MKRLRWLLQQAIDRHGWPAVTGVLLLAGCAVFYAALIAPLERAVRAAQESSSFSLTATRREALDIEDSMQRALGKFYGYFQGREALQKHLVAIERAARAAGLSLRRAEYRVVDEPIAKLKQYRVSVPVADSYPRIRRFISTVLNEVPVASLDSLILQRRKIGDATVEAEIQLTVFFREEI